jgi:OmpA-OmpF porin, OOP family
MQEEASTHSSQSVVRVWLKVEPPAWPFVWRGLLPLALLLAALAWGLTRFASNTIEASVREHVTAVLKARGEGWARVAVSGQQVELSGEAPTEGAGERALDMARQADCPTWLGPMPCAISVKGAFSRAAAPSWPGVRASLEGTTLRVTGTLPDEASRASFEARAQALVRPPAVTQVKTTWSVSGARAPEGWEALGARTLEVVSRCLSGWAELRDGVFSASCTVDGAQLAALEAIARAPTAVGQVGAVGLEAAVDVQAVVACEAGLAKALEGTRIEFAVSSAALLPRSAPLVERIARIASGCPGTLRIEGHTDAVGALEANTALSRQRAESVRAALVKLGLAPARLVSEGFGPSRPLATNDTAEGRARNRRIEFHVVRNEGTP